MTKQKMKAFLVFLLIPLFLALLQCSQPSKPGSDLSSEYSIYLTGRVLDKDGKPMANAVAKLAGSNLSDTTGSDGYYAVTRRRGADTTHPRDSLQILKAGQVITSIDIIKWIDTLPDVFIVQRDIYGSLSSAPASFSRITATITGDSIPDSLAQIAELGYIPATGNYSGFVYFVYTTQLLYYNVYVSVYNSDGVMIGRSIIITFPSTAGDISMPDFNPNNATPTVYAGDDTTVSINDTIRLHATAADSFGGQIAKYEWSINGGSFIRTSTTDTVIKAPADSNSNYICAVRVTDNHGLATTDTMSVAVVLDPPVANAGADTVVNKNSQVTLHGSASQQFGTIAKWEWNIGNSGFRQTSTSDTTITTPDSFVSAYSCILRVTDDDGQVGKDTVNLQVGLQTPALALPADGSTGIYIPVSFAWNRSTGTDYYCIHVSGAADFSSLAANDTIRSSIDTISVRISSSLVVGTTYYWRVKAFIRFGASSDWSPVRSFTTVP